jgi:hypothetical protein
MQKRLAEIEKYNSELISKLNKLLEENEAFRPKKLNKFPLLTSAPSGREETETETAVLISGINLDDAVNLEYLSRVLKDVEFKIKELNDTQSKRYGSKQQKSDLQVCFL